MSDKPTELALSQMLTAAAEAIGYIDGYELADFLADSRTRRACAMCLVQIGDLGSRLRTEAPDFVASHPEISWQEMRGLRNRIAHGYGDLDFNAVWDTLQDSLPTLIAQLEAILAPRAS